MKSPLRNLNCSDFAKVRTVAKRQNSRESNGRGVACPNVGLGRKRTWRRPLARREGPSPDIKKMATPSSIKMRAFRKTAVFDGLVWGRCCYALGGSNRSRGNPNTDADAYDHSASWFLHSGRRVDSVSGINPAAQRGRRGLKTWEERSGVRTLRIIQSFLGGLGDNSAIRK
jgi:hypothetical protein